MKHYILGLGSNIGVPLDNLRQAVRALRLLPDLKITSISPVYLSAAQLLENAPVTWQQDYLNIALGCETDLAPRALLDKVKQVEKKLGRIQAEKWAPRIIDIDLLSCGLLNYDDTELILPHRELLHRPFALLPLLDIDPTWAHPRFLSHRPEWLDPGVPIPFDTRRIPQRVLGPQLMGVVNITPDSFSDGGQLNNLEKVTQHVTDLIQAGADIIDIGAEATHPRAELISQALEWQRLLPVLRAIDSLKIPALIKPKISLDTRHAKTVEQALNFNIDWINDQCGQEIIAIGQLLKGTQKNYVSMHQLGLPASPKSVLPLGDHVETLVYDWAEKRIETLMNLGFTQQQIIIDPGIGFGKTAEQCWQLIRKAKIFKSLNQPILFGHSRKLFLNLVTQAAFDQRDFPTAIIAGHLARQGIDFLRVHNINRVNEVLQIEAQLAGFRVAATV